MLFSYGNVLQQLGELEPSQNNLQQSLEIAQRLQLPLETSLTEFSLGNTARSLSNIKGAIAHYENIDASYIAYRLEWQLGRLLKAQGNMPAAISAYDAAVTTLQSLRNDLVAVNRDVQFNFSDRIEPLYRQSVELILQEK